MNPKSVQNTYFCPDLNWPMYAVLLEISSAVNFCLKNYESQQ